MADVADRVFKPSGALTMQTAGSLLAEGRALAAGGNLVIDFAAVTESDSAALALLLDWMRTCAQAGGRVAVRSLPASLTSLAQLYGVDELLPQDEAAERS